MTRKPTLVSLQYLRAIAALLVVYFHAVVQTQRPWVHQPLLLTPIGESGVDIFFVLSGLVMWISAPLHRNGTLEFYRRRIIRIVPLYWSATLVAALVALAIPRLLYSTRFDWAHVAASLSFIPWPNPALPDLPAAARLTPVIVPGWTLNYEMFFYVLFGLALFVPSRLRVAALAAAFTAIFLACRMLPDTDPRLGFYGSGLLFEFLLGIVVALALNRDLLPGPRVAALLLVAGFAALVAANFLHPPVDRAIAWGVPAMLIVYAAIAVERGGALPKLRWLETLGAASYSIYLTHVFTIALLRVACVAIGLPVEGAGTVAFIGAALVVSALIGVAVWSLYERRANDFAKRLLVPRHGAGGTTPRAAVRGGESE